MTKQPKELFSVTLKTEKEIEHDKELQRAYQRGYEDGARSRPALPADALDHSPCAVENCSVRYRAGGSQSNGEWVCSEADHTPIKKLKVCPAWLKAHDAAIRKDERKKATQGRKVITLCGSVKFWDEYREWNARLTLEGNIVFSCGLSLKEGYEDLIIDLPLDDVKRDLDFIHLRKIDLSDEIFVLNVGGYIGESTKREITYAESKGKRVRYLESLRREGEPR